MAEGCHPPAATTKTKYTAIETQKVLALASTFCVSIIYG